MHYYEGFHDSETREHVDKLHLKHHLFSHTRRKAHFVVRTRQQAIEVRLAVQKPKIDLEKVLDVSNVLQNPQQSVVVHFCHLQWRRHRDFNVSRSPEP